MTQEEKDIVILLGEAFNKFNALEALHPSDKPDFCNHIHALQNIVFAREGMRQYAAGLPAKQEEPKIRRSAGIIPVPKAETDRVGRPFRDFFRFNTISRG
ncbi:MAG TPA: hypothetical protein VD794_11960 [Flavisolibacter sp.]|nr:hypothetical protein [Flavisolibacter sp.]